MSSSSSSGSSSSSSSSSRSGGPVAPTELTVAFSSLAERVGDIRITPRPGVEILLCVQGETAGLQVPPGVDRVLPVPGRGVARSRNAAIQHCRTRYLLFCDDDVEVDFTGVLSAVAHLRTSGEAIALGRAVGPDGQLRKRYRTNRPTRLTRLNSGKAATYEMLIDVEQVREAGVRFDERFGAGTQTYLGDEYLFIAELLHAGLRGHAVPFVFGIHPRSSSGSRWGGPDLHVRAVVINHVFGRTAPFARLLFAWRNRRSIGNRRRLVEFLTDTSTLHQRKPRRPGAALRPSEPSEH